MIDIPRKLQLLFSTYPPLPGDARSQMEAIGIALRAYDQHDVDAALDAFMSGQAPGHNPAFAPSAPMLAVEAKRQQNIRLESEERTRRYEQPQLAAPLVVHSPDERTRVKAKIDEFVAAQVAEQVHADEAKARKALFDATNARFYPDMSPDAVKDRLHLRHVGVGDADGDRDVA